MISRAMRTARTVSSASGGDDRKLKLIAGGLRGSAAVVQADMSSGDPVADWVSRILKD